MRGEKFIDFINNSFRNFLTFNSPLIHKFLPMTKMTVAINIRTAGTPNAKEQHVSSPKHWISCLFGKKEKNIYMCHNVSKTVETCHNESKPINFYAKEQRVSSPKHWIPCLFEKIKYVKILSQNKSICAKGIKTCQTASNCVKMLQKTSKPVKMYHGFCLICQHILQNKKSFNYEWTLMIKLVICKK